MEPLVDFVIEDPRWTQYAAGAEAAVLAAMTDLGLPHQGFTLCIMGCDDARIAALNADFRGKATPTNVLSWPSEDRAADMAGAHPDLPQPGGADDPEHLGDIAIAFDTCQAEAMAAGISVAHHTAHLIIHGLLHLLGYDHIRDADGDLMETIESRILAQLGIADPYLAA